MVSALENIFSFYPVVSILVSALWQEDLVNLALISKKNYGALRESSIEYWRLLHSKTRKGCKFEETNEYNHGSEDTPSQLSFRSKESHGGYWILEFPELKKVEREGVCVKCRDCICKGCTYWNKITDVLELSPFSPLKSDLLWRCVRHFCLGECSSKKLKMLHCKRAELKICRCDVAPLMQDVASWVCPPFSYKNDDKDKLHNKFQEECLKKFRGDKGVRRKKVELWEDLLDLESEVGREEKWFCGCGCGASGEDVVGEGFMICSWCDGEVKMEW